MRLMYLRASGFRGLREPFAVDVPEGFLVVTGRNGTGKSTCCDILEYALTGSIRRFEADTERKERISDYYWWRGSEEVEDAYVAVGFVDEAGEVFEVRRSLTGLVSPAQQGEVEARLIDATRAPDAPLDRLLATAIIRDEEITRLSIDLPEADRFKFVRNAIGENALPRVIGSLQDGHDILTKLVTKQEAEYERVRARIDALVEQIAERKADLVPESDIVAAERTLKTYLQYTGQDDDVLAAARHRMVEDRSSADRLAQLARDLEAVVAEMQQLSRPEYQDQLNREDARRMQLAEAVAEATSQRSRLAAEFELLRQRQPIIAALAAIVSNGESIGREGNTCPALRQ